VADQKLGVTKVVHDLDDVLLLAESTEKCHGDLQAFMGKCGRLEIPFSTRKDCGFVYGITIIRYCARYSVDGSPIAS